MAEKEFTCEYKVLFPIGNKMRERALEIYNSIVNARNALESMHLTWDGSQWNALATKWNGTIEFFHAALDVLVKTVPETMESISIGYSLSDSGSAIGEITRASYEPLAVLPMGVETNLTLSNGDASTEREYQDEVDKFFRQAKESLDEMKTILDGTKDCGVWEGKAAEDSRNNFNNTYNLISTDIEAIKEAVKKNINEAIAEIQAGDQRAIENANNL